MSIESGKVRWTAVDELTSAIGAEGELQLF